MGFFPGVTSLLKETMLIIFFISDFLENFFYVFPFAMYKKFKLSVIWGRELCLFKGLYLLFLQNVTGATFIPGAMPIPDSRLPGTGNFFQLCGWIIQIKKSKSSWDLLQQTSFYTVSARFYRCKQQCQLLCRLWKSAIFSVKRGIR